MDENGFRTELFPYQKEAVEKLRKTPVAALYMEMGTGKTRVQLELLKIRKDKDRFDEAVWFCPCSVKANLQDEIEFQWGEMPCWIRIVGTESIQGSDRLYSELLGLVKEKRVYLIVDESNMIKNPRSKRTVRITELGRYCKYKSILNGTPVSRTEADMFAQWYFLDPDILGYQSYYSFAANHLEYYTVTDPYGRKITTDRIKRVLDVDYLTERVSRFCYQKKKADCGIELPPKKHGCEIFDLTWEQEEHYEKVKDLYLSEVDETDDATIYRLFTALQHVSSGRRVLTGPGEKMRTEDFFSDPFDNPRVECFRELAEKIGDQQAVVFAKYKAEIEEMEAALTEDGKTFARFTGDVKLKDRNENLRKFRRGDVQFLLANKSCGAYGLNLQTAHIVIFYSNDFDYATRMQAQDRVHRLGQKNPVTIYDIVGVGTIDTFISENIGRKAGMVSAFKSYLEQFKKESFKESIDEADVKEAEGAEIRAEKTVGAEIA